VLKKVLLICLILSKKVCVESGDAVTPLRNKKIKDCFSVFLEQYYFSILVFVYADVALLAGI